MTPFNDDTAVLTTESAVDQPEDPRTDDLASELAKAAPRVWWNKATIVLGSLALLLGGFVGGLQAQKNWGTASTSAPGGRNGQARTGAGGNFGGGNFGGAQGGAGLGTGAQGGAAAPGATSTAAAGDTTGTVKLVDGTTIYVQTAAGDVMTVKTDGKTTVSAATKGKVKDVKAGQSITVQGAAGTDGSVTATSVITTPK